MSTTIPALTSVTDILDNDLVMITHSNGESFKIAGSEINKRNQAVIASTTTMTGAPLKTGNIVRVYFTADITGSNTTTGLVINYNNVNYSVKVPKNGTLANFVASNLGGSPAVYKYLQANTMLELLYDGTQFIINGNPVVISGTNFSIYADGLKRVDEVTEDGTDLVTSHAVAAAINKVKDIMSSLPTDAVLHYSFDEVPDYPDGIAVYFKNKDWTVSDNWNVQTNNATYSVDNGVAVWTLTNNGRLDIQKIISNIAGKILKIKFRNSASGKEFRVNGKIGTDFVRLATYITNGDWQEKTILLRSDISTELILSVVNDEINSKLEISSIYIGDGSYSTPIIDNANGQNNATNNGGIAIKGVSGKGAYFLNDKYANVGTEFQFLDDFSCSIWCKPESFTSNCHIIRKQGVFTLVIVSGNLIVYLYDSNGNALLDYFTLSSMSINQFTHIVVVRNGLSFKYYKNGVLAKSATLANTTTKNNNNILSIGSDVTSVAHTEDDLLIFDRALTENEVMALYLNRGNTPKYYSLAD